MSQTAWVSTLHSFLLFKSYSNANVWAEAELGLDFPIFFGDLSLKTFLARSQDKWYSISVNQSFE